MKSAIEEDIEHLIRDFKGLLQKLARIARVEEAVCIADSHNDLPKAFQCRLAMPLQQILRGILWKWQNDFSSAMALSDPSLPQTGVDRLISRPLSHFFIGM